MQAADNTVGALQRQESELQLVKKIIGVYSRRMKALTGTTTQIHYGDCSEELLRTKPHHAGTLPFLLLVCWIYAAFCFGFLCES